MSEPSPSRRRFASESRSVLHVLQRKQSRCHRFPAASPLVLDLTPRPAIVLPLSCSTQREVCWLETEFVCRLKRQKVRGVGRRISRPTEFKSLAFFQYLQRRGRSALFSGHLLGHSRESQDLPLHILCTGTHPPGPWDYPDNRPWLRWKRVSAQGAGLTRRWRTATTSGGGRQPASTSEVM